MREDNFGTSSSGFARTSAVFCAVESPLTTGFQDPTKSERSTTVMLSSVTPLSFSFPRG